MTADLEIDRHPV